MFEFTMLGVVVALVGSVYLFTVGWWLTPERITAEEDLPADFDLTEYLTEVSDSEGLDLLPEVEMADAELETPEHSQGLVEVVVAPQSSLVGETLASIRFLERYDATVLALRRGPELIRSRLDESPRTVPVRGNLRSGTRGVSRSSPGGRHRRTRRVRRRRRTGSGSLRRCIRRSPAPHRRSRPGRCRPRRRRRTRRAQTRW
jgi:hypothetical protein